MPVLLDGRFPFPLDGHFPLIFSQKEKARRPSFLSNWLLGLTAEKKKTGALVFDKLVALVNRRKEKARLLGESLAVS
ncbi:MAG: hypothetical protein E2O92_05635 [Alphaproteobacteria bacterium]|nr:MAG: hypothetical protein E2O92_05635 [Alphaproteobacteria bacterium]